MDVISLLQDKKRCLRRFLDISELFLAEAEKENLAGLTGFDAKRESVIKTLGLIDRRLTDCVRALPTEARTTALSQAVQLSLDEEAYLVGMISRIDARIVACIEREKERLTRELALNRRSHEMAGRFKSTWIAEAGEALDQKA